MGEPSHSFTSGHIWSPIMRSSRGKLFVYFSVLGAMCFVVFLLSNAHSNLKQLEGANEKCQQQQDSLSAQLQVVYEHKNRLEKSLQQEKSDYKRAKEDIEKQLQQEESKVMQEKERERSLENQISQLKSLNSELEETKKADEISHKDQLQSMQAQKDSEIKKLQEQISELLAEKDKLEHDKGTLAWKMEQHMNEASVCHLQQQQLNEKLTVCTEELQKKKEDQLLDDGHNKQLPRSEEKRVSPVSPSSTQDKPERVALDRPHVVKSDENKVAEAANMELENKEKPEEVSKFKQNNTDLEKHQLAAPFSEHNSIKDDAKGKELMDNEIHGDLQKRQDPGDLPQVQPPAERGEYANGMEQLEQPHYRGISSDLKKDGAEAQNLNDLKDAQVHDMMLKSPDGVDPQHVPPIQEYANKIINYQPNLVKGQAELPVGDKHYGDEDDDDQEGENEDDPMGDVQPGPAKFHEQDFDGQDANENKDGVMVAPK